MALTSRRHVLETLSEAIADRTLRRAIAQLRELSDQMNTDVFLPLTEAGLSDVAVPRRLINYATWSMTSPVVSSGTVTPTRRAFTQVTSHTGRGATCASASGSSTS